MLCLMGERSSGVCIEIQRAHKLQGLNGLRQFRFWCGKFRFSSQNQRTDIRPYSSKEMQNHLSVRRKKSLPGICEAERWTHIKADCSCQKQALCKWLYLARMKDRRQMVRQASGMHKLWKTSKEAPQHARDIIQNLFHLHQICHCKILFQVMN